MNTKAEFVGLMLGDGNIHKTSDLVTVTGSMEDYHYYSKHLIPMMRNLFQVSPKLKKRNDKNSYYVYFWSKKATQLVLELGLNRGNKIYNAKIPDWIFDFELSKHFLRGLFDTDGSLKFSKQCRDNNYYPRIQFCFKNCIFSRQLAKVLDMHFEYSTWIDKRDAVYYMISGKDNLEKWNTLIGFKNDVHKSKYLYWKKYGFCIPKSTLVDRAKALNMMI